MFKSPQNIKAAGGLPVSWVHFTKEDPEAQPTVCVSLCQLLMMREKRVPKTSLKFNPDAFN